MTEPVRVVVVDDHPVFRMGMVALLASLTGIDVVGEAAAAAEAVASVDEHRPDVVLMDLHLGDSSGVDATREIARAHPEIGVLVVTVLDDDSVFASMRARGHLLKGADPVEVERALAGRHPFPSSPSGSVRSSTRWRAASTTCPSRGGSRSVPRRCGTTCPTS